MDKLTQLKEAAEALAEDAEMVDGDCWGYLVSVAKLDALRTALDALKEDS